jgi:hypothetical protein
MYPRVCVNCREEFSPIEGNETRDFCSWECEDEYPWDPDENTQAYNEGYGRKTT